MTSCGCLVPPLLARCLVLLAALPAARADTPSSLKTGVTIEGITEYRLPNGVRVLLFPDPSSPKVTVNLTVLVGSRHEGYGETGMAHLLEHMVFKGTPTHPDIKNLTKGRGAPFNARRSTAPPNSYETLPAPRGNLAFP